MMHQKLAATSLSMLISFSNLSVHAQPLANSGSFTIDSRLPIPKQAEKEQIENAQKLMKVGRYRKAIELLGSTDAILQKDAIFFRVLECYFLNGDFDQLITACERWLDKNAAVAPKSLISLVYEFIGTAKCHKADFKAAVTAFDYAISKEPSFYAFSGRAQAYLGLKEEKLAAADFQKAQIDSERAPSLNQILELSIGQSNAVAPAVEFLSEKQESQINSKVAKNADELEKKGDFVNAIKLYEKAAGESPSNSSLWGALGLSAMTIAGENGQQNQYQKLAASAYQKAISLNEMDWRIWNNVGIFKYCIDDGTGARAAFEKALQNVNIQGYQQWRLKKALSLSNNMEKLQTYFKK